MLEAVAPALSVTVRLAVYVPTAEYVCAVVRPVPVVVSPNDQAYVAIVPSGSADAPASKDTTRGARPDVGVAVNAATGGWFKGGGCDVTLMACVAVAVAPALSVTVRRAV